MMSSFESLRRQGFIDEESYKNTLEHYALEEKSYAEQLKDPRRKPGDHASTYDFWAAAKWEAFQLRYTGGSAPEELRDALGEVVASLEAFALENEDRIEADYAPPFRLADMIDNYVDYLNVLSCAILLHREDLIPRIFHLIEGSYDGEDAVLEELFKFYLPARPSLDQWIWEKPYRTLLDAIDAEDRKQREALMRKYVSTWYKAMKGQAHFWGKHEKIDPMFSPYVGYWAFCAAAFTYLYDIDDRSYRDELVYPKDLVDYARSMPRRTLMPDETLLLRVAGGQSCPKDGTWFSPAKMDSARYFKAGETMPSFDASEYGTTIWQFIPESTDR